MFINYMNSKTSFTFKEQNNFVNWECGVRVSLLFKEQFISLDAFFSYY